MKNIVEQIRKTPPTEEGWTKVVYMLMEECLENYDKIDWKEVNKELNIFSDPVRNTEPFTYLGARNGELFKKLEKGKRLRDFHNLYSTLKYYKTRGSGKGTFLGSPVLYNLTHIWFYYRESEEHQMELTTLFSSKHLVNLEHIKFQAMYFSDYTKSLVLNNIKHFPKLRKMIFYNMYVAPDFLKKIKEQGIEVSLKSEGYGYY